MKILFYHGLPYSFAHGGLQVQIDQTKSALEAIGVEVDYLRWWDEAQKGDILHIFGRVGAGFIKYAQQKKMRVVTGELLTAQGSRPPWKHLLHRVALRGLEAVLPAQLASSLSSEPYRLADACTALTSWEAHLMTTIFAANPCKVHVVPNGVENVFLQEPACPRGKWLVCTATIAPRKRVLELARTAVESQTPLWIIGRPYSEENSYYAAFKELAQKNSEWIRFEGPIGDRARLAHIYREARGFVLLSTMESLSLSALEAVACECPLFLSDLPWAHSAFKEGEAIFCPLNLSTKKTALHLKDFYEKAPSFPVPPKPLSWVQVAEQLRCIYQDLLTR